MVDAEKMYRKCKCRSAKCAVKLEYKMKQDLFDKKYRYYERLYKRGQKLELDVLNESNPHAFRDKIRRLGPKKRCSIPQEMLDKDTGEVMAD